MADDQNELTARLSINHYKIVSLLGSGGMGKVYLAEDRLLERKVALKLLPSEFASDLDRLHRWDLHKSENSTTEEAVKKSFTRQYGEVFRSSLQTVGPSGPFARSAPEGLSTKLTATSLGRASRERSS